MESYINSDHNVVWQELLRRNQLKAARQCELFTVSECNPDSTGETDAYLELQSSVHYNSVVIA